MNKKAQISMETIMVVGIILLITIPLLSYALYNVGTKMSLGQETRAIRNVADTIETLSYLGEGSAFTTYATRKIVIRDNVIYNNEEPEEAEISIPLVPSVPDTDIDEGTFHIVNAGNIVLQNKPSIDKFVPTSGYPGTVVTIYGNHITENSAVVITGDFEDEVVYTYLDAQTITFVTPTPVGPLLGDLTVPVKITAKIGRDFTTESAEKDYTIIPPPLI